MDSVFFAFVDAAVDDAMVLSAQQQTGTTSHPPPAPIKQQQQRRRRRSRTGQHEVLDHFITLTAICMIAYTAPCTLSGLSDMIDVC